MEVYSPSHVTRDSSSEESDTDARQGYLHDDRAEVEYEPPKVKTSHLRSKFSSDEQDTDLAVVKERSDLRKKLESRRNSISDRGSARRSRSRSHSRSRYRRHYRRQSSSRSRRSRGSRDRSRGRSRSRSMERSRNRKSSYYKEDKLDIEIRIKNESRANSRKEVGSSSRSHRSKEAEDSNRSQDGSSSTMSKMYTKYTEEHYKKLAAFKKSLEEKFNVSVDSIVNGILDTKSATEIKDLLKVDIDKVPSKAKAPVNATAKYEQCMHCGKLFHVNSPPDLCVKCHKPRDEMSLEATMMVDNPPYDPFRQPVAPPPTSFPPGPWSMIPPGNMPMIPPGHMPMIPPPPQMVPMMPQWNMPQFPPNIAGLPPNVHDLTPANPPPTLTYSNEQSIQTSNYPTAINHYKHVTTQSSSSSALPAIRGHTLLPPGFAPPDHLFALNQKSNSSDYTGLTGQTAIVIPDEENKDRNDVVPESKAPSTQIKDDLNSRPDPQSFEGCTEKSVPGKRRPVLLMNPVTNSDNSQPLNPADLMRTLVTRNY